MRHSLEAAQRAGIAEIDEALRAFAVLAARRGDLEHAARLAGAGDAHAPASMNGYERRIEQRLLAEYLPARQRMGGPTWDAIAAQGRRLDLPAAIDLGLAAASSPSTPALA
jgi:hypothetical protein